MNGAARREAWRRGRLAEALSVWRLRLGGWRIVATNHKTPVGEIDIIARRGSVLAFVEVKARPTVEEAAEAIAAPQRRRIERAAEAFLAREPRFAALDARFDVMLVLPWRLPQHLPDAWRRAE